MLVAVFALAPSVVTAAPWRSVSAPASTFALAEYVMQAPGNTPDPGTGSVEDTTDTEPIITEPAVPPPSQQPPPPTRQPGSVPDTVRADSARAFPGVGPALAETIGPGSAIRIPQAVAPPVHTRHGFLGLAPIALLAGLIVLHIFVVAAVAK